VKEHKNGTVTYEHQMLAAVLVHPDLKEVIPLAPEPIQKQDGSTKNDCERNAARRLLQKIRQEHPRLKLIVVEDGLASNGPHVRDLIACDMHFILGVKPGDHVFLFAQVEDARRRGYSTTLTRIEKDITARCDTSTSPCSTTLPEGYRFRPWTVPKAVGRVGYRGLLCETPSSTSEIRSRRFPARSCSSSPIKANMYSLTSVYKLVTFPTLAILPASPL